MFYCISFICPLRCLFYLSLNIIFFLILSYSFKRFNFIFLREELFTLDYFGLNLFFITLILTLGCLFSIFLRINSVVILFLRIIFMASCRIALYLSFHIIEFYINFELTLFPIIFIILGWGYQPERFFAGFILLIYTISGSLPFLAILRFLINFQILNFIQLSYYRTFLSYNSFLRILVITAFLIKLPIFIFHSWLPKAHVEAPVYGSIFLAGTLLKLGALRLYRIAIFNSFFFNRNFIILSSIGIVFIRIICIISRDIKILIAYSSIIHMGIALILVLYLSKLRFLRRLIIFITHGLSSSLIFLIAYIIYKRSNSRRLLTNQNISLTNSLISLFWFIRCIGIIGGPPASTLLRELIGFRILISNWTWFLFLFIPRTFFRGVFRITLFSRTSHGFINLIIKNILPLNFNELLIVLYHIFWLIIYFFIFRWILMINI